MTNSYHHGDLKSSLLAYALAQMEGEGLDGLSMREMAKAVGVSHTAAYRHFADKQALLDAIAEQGFEALLQASRRDVAAAHGSQDRLLASGLAYVRFGREHPQQLAHMFSAASRGAASPSLRAVAAQLFDDLRALVSQGQLEGTFCAGDTRELAHGCWAMVHGLALLQGDFLLGPQPKAIAAADAKSQLDSAATQQAQKALNVLIKGLTVSQAR